MHVHLDVLGWLHVLVGWIGLLTGVAFLILAAGTSTGAIAEDGSATAVVWLLLMSGLVLAFGGWAMVLIGRAVVARLPIGRPAALLMAAVNLGILPFGTALSVYTLWALLNDDARSAFGRRLRGRGHA